MVNFNCQPDWVTWCPDIWSNSILCVSVRVFLNAINNLFKIEKSRLPSIMWWALFNQLKAWIERKVDPPQGTGEFLLPDPFQTGMWAFSCFQTWGEASPLSWSRVYWSLDKNCTLIPPMPPAADSLTHIFGLVSSPNEASQFLITNLPNIYKCLYITYICNTFPSSLSLGNPDWYRIPFHC